MKIVATYNIKGGVGKTAAAVNLSHLAARDGLRVLLADLDPQAAATFLFRVRPRVKGGGNALIRGSRDLDRAIKGTDFDGLDLLPADFTFRNLDLILDTTKKPTLLSEAVLYAADLVLAPIIPTTLSVRTLDQLTEFIGGLDGHRPAVLAFCSMIDRRKRLHNEIAERLPAERDDVAATAIPALSLIERMAVQRSPVTAFAPRSAASRGYAGLWAEVRDRLCLTVPAQPGHGRA